METVKYRRINVLVFVLLWLIFLSYCTADRRFGRGDGSEFSNPLQRSEQIPATRSVEMEGISSYYGTEFHGKKTANGDIFDMYDLTAAHKSLPFGTVIQVENLQNGKQVTVTVNDRGPFVPGRILDLSYAAAEKLDMIQSGTAKVKITIMKIGN